MIIQNNPLSMAESLEYLKKNEKNSEVESFVKRFTELGVKDAKELRKKISELNILKINQEHISKIIDLLPDNSIDLNKIFVGVSLDDDETKRILDIIKEYK